LFGIFGFAQKQKRLARGCATLAILAAMLVTASCAGQVGPKLPPPPNTVSYVVTVTASTANGPTHTQLFTLTVTQQPD